MSEEAKVTLSIDSSAFKVWYEIQRTLPGEQYDKEKLGIERTVNALEGGGLAAVEQALIEIANVCRSNTLQAKLKRAKMEATA